MTKKLIIFDFDGTIADSMMESMKIFNKLSDKYGYKKVAHSEIEIFRDYGVKEFIKKIGVPKWKIMKILKKAKLMLARQLNQIKICAGVDQLIKDLTEKGFLLGILTSNSEENVSGFLKKNKLYKYFDFIESTGEKIFGKHRVIKRIIKEQNLRREECIYIGDELRDVKACRKAKIDVIAVTWGFNSQQALENLGTKYIAVKSEDIVDILEKMG